MFTVKRVITFERYCPNGHPTLPDLLPQSNNSVKYCHVCGTSIEERQVPYDAAFCADCNNPVHPSWNYCPYCGQPSLPLQY